MGHLQCGADPRTRCDCRDAGRLCYICNPWNNCQNHLCTDALITTGLLDSVNGLLCLPIAEMPARRRRTQATLQPSTTWVFDAPATPESQSTQMTILTQAQSQESEGTGNSTHHGSQPPTSLQEETRGSSEPAALHAVEGGAAGDQENDTTSDGQNGANDATQGNTGPGEEAHTTEHGAAD